MTEDAQPPITVGDAPGDSWSVTRKLAFRFVFAYFVLYNIPFPISALPFPEPVTPAYNGVWHAVAPWVGAHLLHLGTPITIFENGSGDTTYHYVLLLCFLILATLITLTWSLLDRRRPNYAALQEWLRVYLRFVLCATMIAYGSFKVIKTQFPGPTPYDLLEPYGEASPMGLLWTFMGFSLPYNVFTGIAEMGAGILLGFRRTTTLGALLAIAVLGNVVMLNFSYDVPVKLYSVHLLVMAVLVLLPDMSRLIAFFLLDHPVPNARASTLFSRPGLNRAAGWLGRVYVVAMVMVFLVTGVQGYKSYGDGAPKPPLYGIYEVSTFIRNGDTLPPLTTDSMRWRRLIVSYPGRLSIRSMSDSTWRFLAEVDTTKGLLQLRPREDSTTRYSLSYARPDSVHLTLTGAWAKDSVHVEMVRRDEGNFLLLNRGFHWINEEPFNR